MAIEFKDYYQVLGLTSTATDEDIKKAFRALARKYHPDVAKDKKTAEEKFKAINEANEVLSNPASRRKYDELGANWKTGGQTRPPPGRSGSQPAGRNSGSEDDFQFEGTGFSDFFEQFFSGRAGRSQGGSPFDGQPEANGHSGPEAARRGQNIRGDILITLDEVLKGAMRDISVRRTDVHTGQERSETYHVRIPVGVQAGQSIRVPGKGGEGVGGGGSGDIVLQVRYAQHPDWQVRGTDLIWHLDLAPWEAVLGTTVPVPTLEGSLTLKVPPGTQPGNQLRVRGQGLPAGPGKRGDLYATVFIQVPAQVNPAEQSLWQQLSSESSFNPRRGQS